MFQEIGYEHNSNHHRTFAKLTYFLTELELNFKSPNGRTTFTTLPWTALKLVQTKWLLHGYTLREQTILGVPF